MNLAKIHSRLAAAAPIVGVALLEGEELAGEISFDESATEAQRDAANALLLQLLPLIGQPEVVDFEEAKAATLTKFRADRELFIARIAQIVTFSENEALMAPAKTLRRGLLDLTSHPSVLAASTEAELKAAMKAVYSALVAAAPAELKTAFKGADA